MPNSIFKVFYVIGLIAGSVIRALHTGRRKGNRTAEDYETWLDKLLLSLSSLGLIILPLLYLLTPWLDFADYRLPTRVSMVAGLVGAVVFIAALWLLWMSHVGLKHNWLPTLRIREGHTLVTRGAYRHIRHPMYAAHWLWGVAQALLLQNLVAGPAMLAFFLPLYLVRVPREEQMMLQHFSEDYRLYMNRTGRVIPRLGK